MNTQLQWRVVDEPQYDGFLAANHGGLVFCIEYDRDFDDDYHDFWLEITSHRQTLELSRHKTPYDAMKAAQAYLNNVGRLD